MWIAHCQESKAAKWALTMSPVANVIKLFMAVLYESVVPGRPLQPSLMFVGKAGSLPKFQALHSMIGSLPYTQTLE